MNHLEIGCEEVSEPVVDGNGLNHARYQVEPMALVDIAQNVYILKTFGSIMAVSAFADEAEAIQRASDVDNGLVAGIIITGITKFHRFAQDVVAGQI